MRIDIDIPPLINPITNKTGIVTGIWWRYIADLTDRLKQLSNVKRVTTTPYSLTDEDHVVFVDTDSAPITILLPAGTTGDYYRVVNVGSSGNDVTLTPDGSELLIGSNSSQTITDGNDLKINYEETEGWF